MAPRMATLRGRKAIVGEDPAADQELRVSLSSDVKKGHAWPVVRIGDVVEINPRPGDQVAADSLASFIPMRCVEEESGRFEPIGDRKVAEVRKGYTAFRDGDVLFAKVTPCMENGKAAVMKGLTNGIGFGSTEFFVLRPSQRIDADYLLHFVLQSEFRQRAAGNMTGAVGLRRVPKSYLEQQLIPLPPLFEQRRIVAEIEKQFTRLEVGSTALRRVQANLTRYRAAVLKAACEGRLVSPEVWATEKEESQEALETGESLLARFLAERCDHWPRQARYKEPLGPPSTTPWTLPAGWTWCTVGQLLNEPLCNGVSVRGSDAPPGIRALRLSAMSESGFDYSDARYLPLQKADVDDLWIRERDFFVSRANGSLRLVGRGTCAQKPLESTIFPDTMIRLRLADDILATGWLRTLWSSPLVRSQIEARVKTTAGIYKIAQPQIEGIVLPLPPLAEQERIVTEVERRLSIIEELEAVVSVNLARSASLRQSILQRAFAGELLLCAPMPQPAL